MNSKTAAPGGIKVFGIIDILVILVFLSTAAASIHLFRLDLMRTIDSYDEEPAGTIIIRNNVIQRRHADRVIWDRIFVDSPVYTGDLIRAAELSAATVHLDSNQINLNENTLIRIQQAAGGKGPLQIELEGGNLSFTAGAEGSGLILNMMGRQIQAEQGAVINAEMGDEGIIVQVNEGSATFIEEGQKRNLDEGTMIAQDASGVERIIPAAVVTSPRPNARYLKNSPALLPVDFVWRSFNIEEGETLRLEIAEDPKFTRNVKVIEDLDGRAQADFDAGLWHWRLACGDTILRTGQLTVADASPPELLSPVTNSVFRYFSDLPQLRFQWSQRSEASNYTVEVSDTPDFANPRISRQVSAASLIQPAPGPGTWYWRVQPVFSSVYEGGASYSFAASFRIEKTNDPQAPAFELSEAPPTVTRAPAGSPSPGGNYAVRPGDTLVDIAWRAYGIAAYWRIIAEANHILDPNLIEVGDMLYLPPVE